MNPLSKHCNELISFLELDFGNDLSFYKIFGRFRISLNFLIQTGNGLQKKLIHEKNSFESSFN